MTARKQLDIYIDESGSFSALSNENQFYSIALVSISALAVVMVLKKKKTH